METKQVIIQNKDEERQFLKEAKKRGWRWRRGDNPTEYVPSENLFFDAFSYVVEIENGELYITTYGLPEYKTVAQFLES